MTKNAIGFVLLDAPHSALNNAGSDATGRSENTVAVKKITKRTVLGTETYPYVSAQAWRKWWRDTLEERRGWRMSPVIRESKIAFTSANPFLYPDDDVFGYMRAMKGETLTRISPLKTSPLMSLVPHVVAADFGVMARFEHMSPDSKEKDNNPVPHEHEFYSTVLKGIFALDLSAVGVFQSSARTGYRNLSEKYVAEPKITQAIEQSEAVIVESAYVLPRRVRAQRAKDALLALPFLSGGAKQALHHTDITPKFVALCTVEGGNNLWMNIGVQDDKKPVSVAAIRQVVEDYADIIVGDVFIGRQEGFADSLAPGLETLRDELAITKTLHLSSPRKAIEAFAQSLDAHFKE